MHLVSSETADYIAGENFTKTIIIDGAPRTVNFRLYFTIITNVDEIWEVVEGTAASHTYPVMIE